MWVIEMPRALDTSSTARWVELPRPADAKFSLPGAALAFSVRSLSVLMPVAGLADSTNGTVVSMVTPTKSFSGL
ncbi:hypothetical protein D9M69_588830 [compost metagenome]